MRYSIIFILLFFLGQSVFSQTLKHETYVKFSGDKLVIQVSVLCKISSKEFNNLTHKEIYHKEDDSFILKSAEIKNKFGKTVRKLKKKDVESRSYRSSSTFYQDVIIESFDLFWNDYPYTIAYSYEIIYDQYHFIANWNPHCVNSSLIVEIPTGYGYRIHQNGELSFEEYQMTDMKQLKWSCNVPSNYSPEVYEPAYDEIIPFVRIIPTSFKYGLPGSTQSWQEFGSWIHNINMGTDHLPIAEKQFVDDLLAGVTNQKEIVRILYHYLQDETQYVNVSIEEGGLISYPAEYVSVNKYGDCKALTTYMKALLKHAGIESFYTIINAGPNVAAIETGYPSQQFNHVILMIPLAEDTVWLENTSNITPFNYLGINTQNRWALQTGLTDNKLIRTPALGIDESLEQSHYHFIEENPDSWSFTLNKECNGRSFEFYNYANDIRNAEDQLEFISNGLLLEQVSIKDFRIIKQHRDSLSISLLMNGKCADQSREVGNLIAIKPLQLDITEFEDPEERKQIVRLNYPINLSDSIVYTMSIGNREIQFPKSLNLQSEFGEYSTTFAKSNNDLVATEQFKLYSGEISLKDYDAFYEFIQSIHNYKKKAVIVLK